MTPYTTFVISAQTDGAASLKHGVYGDAAELNRASGQTTIQARVQNQSYQQTDQANLASGANVFNREQRSLAQVAQQYVDLALVQTQGDVDEPITEAWIAAHIKVDREVVFGSEAYFALVNDPAARTFLQSGTNVLFDYNGEVIVCAIPEAGDISAPEPTNSPAADSGSLPGCAISCVVLAWGTTLCKNASDRPYRRTSPTWQSSQSLILRFSQNVE